MTAFRSALFFVAGLILIAFGQAVFAQEDVQEEPQTVVVIQSAVLTVDAERMFNESDYGQRIGVEVQEASIRLASENREIEAQLTEEELALTEQRSSLSAAEFKALADAFDEKAQRIRNEQTNKANEILSRPEQARAQFLRLAQDVLVEIMRERRALAILHSDTVFLKADVIDITDLAIERINAVLAEPTE